MLVIERFRSLYMMLYEQTPFFYNTTKRYVSRCDLSFVQYTRP
jgi:hypothetical protein